VVFIQVPADRVSNPILVILRLTDYSGQLVEVPGPAGKQRMEIPGQIEMSKPEGWDGNTDLQASFLVNLMIQLQPGQAYTWSVEVDGKELVSTRFQVRSAAVS
jgi:hypothetical protein